MNRLVALVARVLYGAKSPTTGYVAPRLQYGVTRRRWNLRLGISLGVVRTVAFEPAPGERPILSLDVGLGRRSVWATWAP